MKLLAESFLLELEHAGRGRRVSLKEVWTAFQRAKPYLAGSVNARAELHDLLKELTQSETVILPRQKSSYDSVQQPPLPKWIQLPAPAPTVRARERAALVGWHPALAFVPRLERLGDEELDELIAIQAFFRDNPKPLAATVRERSFDLFGNEKRLEELAKGRLFGAGRLSFSILCCTLIRTPCVYRDLGSGTAALIVENKDTFHSSCDAVRRLGSESPVRWVVFGSGQAAITTIDSINDWPDSARTGLVLRGHRRGGARNWSPGGSPCTGLESSVSDHFCLPLVSSARGTSHTAAFANFRDCPLGCSGGRIGGLAS